MSYRVGLCEDATEAVSVGPFQVRYAVGMEPRLEEYRLRYDAFVDEHHWESADACRDGLERDQFDRFSCSALIVDAASGDAAACQRLILPEYLPYGWLTNAEREYRPMASGARVDFKTMPRYAWAEASRLAIAPAYRWGSAKTSLPAMVAISYATLALALAVERSVLFTMSDPRTARLTRRMGIAMHQVGELVDFHGFRGIFQIDLADVLAGVPADWQPSVEQLIEQARRVMTAGALDEPSPFAA